MGPDQAELKLQACAKLAWTHRMMGRGDSAALLCRCLRLARVRVTRKEIARVTAVGSLELEEGRYRTAAALVRHFAGRAGSGWMASVEKTSGNSSGMWVRETHRGGNRAFRTQPCHLEELGNKRSVSAVSPTGSYELARKNWKDAEDFYRSALKSAVLSVTFEPSDCHERHCLSVFERDSTRAIQVWTEVRRLARSVGDHPFGEGSY